MEGAAGKIQELITVGEAFTYENFSLKSPHGYTWEFSPQWITWTTRTGGLIDRLFEGNSAPVKILYAARRVGLKGEGSDNFKAAKTQYLGALTAAIEALRDDAYGEVASVRGLATAPMALSNKVFVVHGHDEKAKQELEIVLGEMGLEPIVLHRQADGGRTLIEKFEHYSDVGYAFILMTPDEVTYLVAEADKPDPERRKELRARPNVIFEFGFFVGRLGRDRTCCLFRGDVVVPSDLSGLIYKKFTHSIEEVAYSITKELKEAGYKLK